MEKLTLKQRFNQTLVTVREHLSGLGVGLAQGAIIAVGLLLALAKAGVLKLLKKDETK